MEPDALFMAGLVIVVIAINVQMIFHWVHSEKMADKFLKIDSTSTISDMEIESMENAYNRAVGDGGLCALLLLSPFYLIGGILIIYGFFTMTSV
jgi:hypothetical protein